MLKSKIKETSKPEDLLEPVILDFILKSLENRQQELNVHAVTNDFDMEAFKGLVQSGALKRMLITPKK